MTDRSHLTCERLEPRRLLVAVPQVDPNWFAVFAQPVALRRAMAEPSSEWIVQLTDESVAAVRTPADAAAKLRAELPGVEVMRGLGGRGQLLVTATASQAAALGRRGDVATVEPNGSFSAAGRLSNDPRLLDGSQWGLRNTGPFGGVAGADIDAAEAWSMTVGRDDVVVAVIDGGIDISHPDLAANVWRNPREVAGNSTDDDANGFINDVSGWNFYGNNPTVFESGDNDHATLVAGIIAARGDNGVGGVGVSWNARIMPLKFIGPGGSGPTSAAIAAINYATMMRQRGVNLRVINASWGGGPYNAALDTAIRNAGNAGILFVASAGNSGLNDDLSFSPNYPAAYTAANIISVAATDRRDTLWWSSNYGLTRVDLGAPGVDIFSTVPGGYGTRSGTSFAAPFVAGTAALALSVDTSLSVAALRQAILDGVDPLPALAGKTVSGGRLNAARTLALVVPPLAVEYITTLPGAEVIDATVRSDARQLVIRGGGRVVLTAASQHTGGTVVEAGEVIIRNPAALGSGALEVRAGAEVTLDVASNEIAVGALKLADSGRLDLGYGRVTIDVSAASVQDGLGLAKVQDLLRDAYSVKWAGAGGFATRTAGLVVGGGLAYLDNGGGSITVGFAAKGDSNLDGVVDILDAANVLGGGKIDAGSASTWLEGDFNYDGVVDVLDVADFVSTGLFEAGSYRPLHAAQPEITSTTLSAIDAAFMAFAADSAVSTKTSTTKKLRFASMS